MYGNPTPVTRFKFAPNMAIPITPNEKGHFDVFPNTVPCGEKTTMAVAGVMICKICLIFDVWYRFWLRETLNTLSREKKQVSAEYLPSLCTNKPRVRSPVPALLCTWFPVQTCFRRFFSGHSGFPPASKTGPKIWSEGPPGKQWFTPSEATLSKYGLF